MADSDRNNLTPAQTRAVGALASGQTMAEAAKAAGVSARTLRRWRRDARFQRALNELVREAYAEGLRQLAAWQPTNLAKLKLLSHKAGSESVQLRAAQTLEHALNKRYELRSLEELSARLDALEAELDADDKAAHGKS